MFSWSNSPKHAEVLTETHAEIILHYNVHQGYPHQHHDQQGTSTAQGHLTTVHSLWCPLEISETERKLPS